MSGDTQDQEDPRDHDWGVERAKPTENSGRVWNWSWQAQTHARDETVLLCAAAGGDGCYSPSVVSPFTSERLVVCLQSLSSSLGSSSSLSLSRVSPSSLCQLSASCWRSVLPRTLSCWCELVDFLCLRRWLWAHTHTRSLFLSCSHSSSLPIHSQSLQPSLAPPPPPLSLSHALSLFHSLALPLT